LKTTTTATRRKTSAAVVAANVVGIRPNSVVNPALAAAAAISAAAAAVTSAAAAAAIAAAAAGLSSRYFFESDMLHELGLVGAVVRDVPLDARYGSEKSSLSLSSAVVRFSFAHAGNTVRRLFYNYFLRDFSAASVELALGVALLAFGFAFGALQWVEWNARGVGAYAGTVMLAALPVILGVQLLLAFISFDVSRVPRSPLHPGLVRRRGAERSLRSTAGA
jgi:hypothetical protein